MLLRDGATGVEAYLLRRVASMAFAAGMHVFPGGAVDPRDGDADVPWAGPPPASWAPRLSAPPSLVAALACAAVRETFEEAGVLLAGPHAGAVVDDTTGPDWEDDRAALVSHDRAFSDLLRRRGLVLRADLLAPWTHWITPEFEERRYDTRFFVAALPAGQRTRDVGGEADATAWVRPAEAVARAERGELAMMPPTVTTLRDVAAYRSVADVLAAAAARSIAPILPKPVDDEGSVRLLLPGDDGYLR